MCVSYVSGASMRNRIDSPSFLHSVLLSALILLYWRLGARRVQCSQCDVVLTCNKWEKFVESFSVYSFHWRRRQWQSICEQDHNYNHLSQRDWKKIPSTFLLGPIFSPYWKRIKWFIRMWIERMTGWRRNGKAGTVTAQNVRADTSCKAIHMRIMDLFRWFGSPCPQKLHKLFVQMMNICIIFPFTEAHIPHSLRLFWANL